jgi:hypothetical protein
VENRYQVAGGLGIAPRAGRAVDDGRRRGHRWLDVPAGRQVRGEESNTRRDGPVVPGEHADVATAVQQARDNKLPEAAGAASDKDRRDHGLSLRSLAFKRGELRPLVVVRPFWAGRLSHWRDLDGHFYVRQRRENVTNGRT